MIMEVFVARNPLVVQGIQEGGTAEGFHPTELSGTTKGFYPTEL